MHSGQNFLVIGSIVLFSMLIISFYQGENYRTATTIYSDALLSSSGIGQSLLSEILMRKFDENTINDTLETPSELTTSGSLGTDSGESAVISYDDVDDFDGYTQIDSLSILEAFTTNVEVYYVNPSQPDVKTSTRTFYKRIDIGISNSYLTDTTKFYYIISY